MKNDYEQNNNLFQAQKEAKLDELKCVETKLFTEEFTKSVLTIEKQEL